MQEFYLDGAKLGQEPHAYLRDTLGLPDYYGNNLDALYDCLTGICTDTKIIIAQSGRADAALVDVFRDAEKENPFLALRMM